LDKKKKKKKKKKLYENEFLWKEQKNLEGKDYFQGALFFILVLDT